MIKPILLLVLSLFLSNQAFAQSIFDSLSSNSNQVNSSDLPVERVERISISRRIFIITNKSNSFGKGDFITLLVENQPIARALVAKLTPESLAGIKIVTIYSLGLWNQLRMGSNVQILRGDDSFLRNRQNQETEPDDGLIKDETDLFDETTFLEDDLNFEENSDRNLKNDHMLSVYMASIEGVDGDFQATRYNQWSVAYAYQLDSNIFVEAAAGRRELNDFPPGIDSAITTLTAKLKYTFAGPYFTFFQPYVGYQIISAQSDDAGVPSADNSTTPEQLQDELDLIAETEKNRAIFGVTALRRLVPGWFIRVDVGTDKLAGGLSLEF